jgi:arginyl-tRNA synthetase
MDEFKDKIVELIKIVIPDQEIFIEKPSDPNMGDFAFPCFLLAKIMKKNPSKIAQDIAHMIPEDEMLEKVEAVGPYINFFLNTHEIANQLIPEIIFKKEEYGRSEHEIKKTVLVESPSPNTNKPLHLGHLRNMLLGQSIHNINIANGKKSFIVQVVNDRGIHICKSMLAYQKFGEEKSPESEGIKPDHFVGNYYVIFANKVKEDPKLEEEAQQMLVKWEQGDPEVIALWKKMNNWVLEGFKETFAKLNFRIEKDYYESDTYKSGKEIILEGLMKGLFYKDEKGAIIADLEDKKLGKKVLLRSDGTSVYITQDIYLAKKRYEDFVFDEMIYVVANEQKYHFDVLFELYRRLGFPFAEKCTHFAYGMIALPDGKMKSREGTVIDVDELLKEVKEMALEELKERYTDLTEEEISARSDAISISAIRFFILKFDPLKDFVYDPKSSLSFEGETGPYVQYTYARICSVMDKAKGFEHILDPSRLSTEEEKMIIKKLMGFPEVVSESARKLNPSMITRYLLDICQMYNEYYHKYQILKEEDNVKTARLMLSKAVSIVIANGLSLLGIEAIERM